MTKPQLVKVEALFYVLQQVIKRSCAYFDTAPFLFVGIARPTVRFRSRHTRPRPDSHRPTNGFNAAIQSITSF